MNHVNHVTVLSDAVCCVADTTSCTISQCHIGEAQQLHNNCHNACHANHLGVVCIHCQSRKYTL